MLESGSVKRNGMNGASIKHDQEVFLEGDKAAHVLSFDPENAMEELLGRERVNFDNFMAPGRLHRESERTRSSGRGEDFMPLLCTLGEGGVDISTPWRCEICNIFFHCSQALGGHKMNSTDHKQRVEKLRMGETADLPPVPRLSLHVYSNEEANQREFRRTRLPPMAQMPGYDRVLLGFPPDVRVGLSRVSSPAAFFSSCNLEVFRRHEKFGAFGGRIIDVYFQQSLEDLESLLLDLKNLPGISQGMDEEEMNEIKIFARMLLTKKKFLDVNRRAVSKRIKGIRRAGGEKLRIFNMKKSKQAAGEPYPSSFFSSSSSWSLSTSPPFYSYSCSYFLQIPLLLLPLPSSYCHYYFYPTPPPRSCRGFSFLPLDR
ncbi:hypothetical protein GUITHDRAFT_143945 [Guillardia theta CCMP2712]|uniref:Uncharacterized protein n=1 Tax=Guillardia theta (strain CCMP2712) TaxID=905079 RepID=L1IR34_GUITC|nr:hypothetical protein GUITHDRAFT_143945 [Guillardia theta CCMP2712]EKX38741.1 hypothetical protein GUITHDRAFT_143945 [Guillardia theta CCMP2712]|eukprot:XP_005825721.1 hypothetical protein GUITHDRAFT_143945 [Guillardia theta CCMP2712]